MTAIPSDCAIESRMFRAQCALNRSDFSSGFFISSLPPLPAVKTSQKADFSEEKYFQEKASPSLLNFPSRVQPRGFVCLCYKYTNFDRKIVRIMRKFISPKCPRTEDTEAPLHRLADRVQPRSSTRQCCVIMTQLLRTVDRLKFSSPLVRVPVRDHIRHSLRHSLTVSGSLPLDPLHVSRPSFCAAFCVSALLCPLSLSE